MEDDLLDGGLLHLEARGRLHFFDGKLTGIQALPLLMETDLTVCIGGDHPEVEGFRRVGGLTGGDVGHMKTSTFHGSTSHGIHLVDGQLRGFTVLEDQLFLVPCIERDSLLPICILIRQIIGGRDGLLNDFIGAGSYPEGDGAVLTSCYGMLVIAVHPFNSEHCSGNRGVEVICVHFGDGKLRLLQIIEDELLVIARAEPDSLSRLCRYHIRVRDGDFRHFIAVHRNASQCGSAVRFGGDIRMVAIVDTFNLKYCARDDLPGLPISFQNGEIGKLVVYSGDSNCAASINIRLIHMDSHRLCQTGKGRRNRDFHEGIQALSDTSDSDNAGGIGGLRADDLPILQDVEYRTPDRIIRVIHFLKLNLDLRIIFKHKVYITLTVPVELLADLVRVTAGGITVGRGYLRRHKGADGHGIPRHILQVAASARGVGTGEAVIHTIDADNSSGQALGRIIRIHFSDAAFTGDFGCIRKCHGDSRAALIGQNHILRSCIVNLVPFRRLQFNDRISVRVQGREGIGSICSSHHFLGKGAVDGLDEESGTGQSLAGVGGVDLADSQLILLSGDGQLAHHHRLDIVGGVITGAGTSIGILIYRTVPPDALSAQVQDVLGPVSERPAIQFIIDAGVIGMLQIVVNIH